MPYSPTDLVIGNDIVVFGKRIRLCSCNQYTREFFDNLGYPQPKDMPLPSDNFEQSQKPPPVKKDKEMLDFLEHSLGGGKVASQKQFLDNDRKVLRFYSKCDEEPFIVHYYLADDTIEIREVHFANNGKDQFSIYLKRGKLPKQFGVNQPGQNPKEQSHVIEDEIEQGMVLNVYGRPFRILGADKFTQQFYKVKFNRHFDLGEVDLPRPPEQKSKSLISNFSELQVPPYNGFGDEEDTLGFVYKLLPDKPKKDFFKYVDNDNVILRYTAKFNTRAPEDLDRRFIIKFFMADDTIGIFEPSQKNSGTALALLLL